MERENWGGWGGSGRWVGVEIAAKRPGFRVFGTESYLGKFPKSWPCVGVPSGTHTRMCNNRPCLIISHQPGPHPIDCFYHGTWTIEIIHSTNLVKPDIMYSLIR